MAMPEQKQSRWWIGCPVVSVNESAADRATATRHGVGREFHVLQVSGRELKDASAFSPSSMLGKESHMNCPTVLLMDQDLPHRISAPSAEAGGAPRYSLVWKLVFFPRAEASPDEGSLCRPEWGQPLRLGSAAKSGQPAWTAGRQAT